MKGRLEQPTLLALLAVAEFMLTLDLSIVNVALPAIRRDLGFSESSLQWVVNGYALAFAGFLLLGGRAADLVGGRRVFIGAMSMFTVASLTSGLAADETMLVGSRVLQGLTAAVLAPATLSILTATYQQPEARNRALAIWTAVAIGGGSVGATLGGALTAGLSWRWIFFVNVPLGAALVARGLGRLPRVAPRQSGNGLDIAGAIAVTGGLVGLTWALMRSNEAGWASGEVLGGFAVAAAALAGFVVIETRVAGAPMLPFWVFRSRLLLAGNVLSFLSFVPVMATWFFLTLYLQDVRSYTPMETGLLLLPVSAAVVAGSQASFNVMSRLDARAVLATGGLVAAAGLGWLARLSTETSALSIILPASIAMAGGGLMSAPITVAGTSAAPEHGGLASGLLNTTRQIGGALGLAVLGTIATAHTTATALGVGAAIFVVTAIAGAIALPARLGPQAGRVEPPAARPVPSRATRRRPGRRVTAPRDGARR
jgi:EmrB/QacA subfamily drug resistance transporter